jgi:FkbM family methyltransferase
MKVADLESKNFHTRTMLEAARKMPGGIQMPDMPYFGYVDVDVFECPPFVMFTNNDTPVVKSIYTSRTFEPMSMKLWCRLARGATGILDIGANVGIYSLAAAALRPDLTIHAFEANPYACARLRVHKMVNEFSNITEHAFAVGNKNKMVSFSWVVKPGGNISSGGSAGVRDRADIETITVPMHALDGTGLAAQLGQRPLVKIDVEGGEMVVIDGMSEVLSLRPDLLLETFSEASCAFINDFLAPIGYSVYLIMEHEGLLVPRPKLMPATINQDHNFNQFLTIRSVGEIKQLLAAPSYGAL